MSEHQLGQFDSWEIITENIARKTCDKSFFKYHGSGVPQGIRWFFNIEKLMRGYLIAKTETFANNPFGEFVRKDIPSLFYKTFSYQNSSVILPYIEEFINDNIGKVLQESMITECGKIIDQEINQFQGR